MRQDKLTTKFQTAIAEAQSLALANDNQYIEPVHLLSAVLADPDGLSKSLLERAGVLVTPGSAFGPSGEGHVRLALVQDEAEMRYAIDAIDACGILK